MFASNGNNSHYTSMVKFLKIFVENKREAKVAKKKVRLIVIV